MPVPPPAEVRPALPAWWRQFSNLPNLESEFVQTSESAVFGTLRKQGRLAVARGGRLRVAYEKGLLLVSDGKRLVQYDPQTHTAQGLDLARAMGEFPLLNVLIDPRTLETSYEVISEGAKLRLKPRRAGLPEVQVEGQDTFPTRITWKDGTGAQQNLSLINPRASSSLGVANFRFDPPKGTRWLGRP